MKGLMSASKLTNLTLCSTQDFINSELISLISENCPALEVLSLLNYGVRSKLSHLTSSITPTSHSSYGTPVRTGPRNSGRRIATPSPEPKYKPRKITSSPKCNSFQCEFTYEFISSFHSPSELQRTIKIRQNPSIIDGSCISRLFEQSHKLQNLTLISTSFSDFHIESMLAFKQLVNLVVWGCRQNVDLENFREFSITFADSLVNMIFHSIGGERINSLIKSLRAFLQNPSLNSLHLQGVLLLSEAGMSMLGGMSGSWRSIELVHTGGSVTDSFISALAQRNQNIGYVQMQNLSICHTGDLPEAALLPLAKLHKLHTIRLQRFG
jgi:hypothetical protein